MKKCFQLLIPPKYRPNFSLTKEGIKRASEIINLHNGRKSIYRTVYNFVKENEKQTAIIDKVFIDFDPDEDGTGGFADAQVLSKHLKEKNIKHSNFFSGRGAHIYVYTHPVMADELNRPSMAMRNFVNELVKETGVTPDYHVIGDLSRVSRIPNTLNVKTNLYCVPVCESMMNCTLEVISSYAKKQQSNYPVIDGDLIDLREYDSLNKNASLKVKPVEGIGEIVGWSTFPDCVQNSLKSRRPGYQERFLIITSLRDLAYSKEEVIKILEENIDRDKFTHCVEEEQQVDYLFDREDMLFPTCNTIKSQGHCVEGCNGQNIYI